MKTLLGGMLAAVLATGVTTSATAQSAVRETPSYVPTPTYVPTPSYVPKPSYFPSPTEVQNPVDCYLQPCWQVAPNALGPATPDYYATPGDYPYQEDAPTNQK